MEVMEGERDIEEVVTDAMGNSVTPSRLHESKKPGLIRRILRNKTVDGPFLDDLEPREQPHYIFHTTNKVEIPEAQAGDWKEISLFGRTAFPPGTLIVTDRRVLLIYNTKFKRVVREFEHSAIDRVYHRRLPRIERSLNLIRDGEEFSFEMWDTEEFTDELTDAAVYISEKSDIEYTDTAFDFEGGHFDEAVDALRTQLSQMGDAAAEMDTAFILENAKTGARAGSRPKTHALGFFLGAGYGIWAETQRGDPGNRPSVDSDQIDPETTAKEMIRWKQFGECVADGKGGLAGAAIGAAIAIDQQISGRQSTSVLSELNLNTVEERLETGGVSESGLEIATQTLNTYSDGLGTLLAEDFFENLRR